MSQRITMMRLCQKYGSNHNTVIKTYARMEEAGIVPRKSNNFDMSATEYATRLLKDGLKKGWL